MKYFLTENGIEPFDMSAIELIELLIDDGTKMRTAPIFDTHGDNMIELIDAVNRIMGDSIYLFKHPDITMQAACDVITDSNISMKHLTSLKWYHTYPKDMIKHQYYTGGIRIVNSINSDIFNYKISYLCIASHRMESLLRKITIDTILHDLA